MAIQLSPEHLAAVARRRRIVVHEDGHMPMEALGMPLDEWMELRFDLWDIPGSQVDAVWWDIGFGEESHALFDSALVPRFRHAGLERWRDAGIDWIAELVRATHARGLECFWSHRISEIDLPQPLTDESVPFDHPSRRNPLKAAHPDWTVPCWWPQGLWNLASPECREHKVRVLREIVTRYEFDGLQLDFARHTPCLPAGREWEMRGEVTAFVQGIRAMLLGLEASLGRPLLLAARVPENERGCRADGFDAETWAREGLVDLFVPGGRTVDVDLAWYRSFTEGTPIRLCGSFDGHHTTDGYYHAGIELHRGAFANFYAQGAHSAVVFNWGSARAEVYERHGFPAMMALQGPAQAFREIGDPETLRGRDKSFIVERRGGYPWAGNYTYRNDDRPLPVLVPPEGAAFDLKVYDRPLDGMASPSLTLRLVLRGLASGGGVSVAFNGRPLELLRADPTWKDGQIYGDAPQPSSGAWQAYGIREDQELLCLEYGVPPEALAAGSNAVAVSAGAGAIVEKIELHVRGEAEAGCSAFACFLSP